MNKATSKGFTLIELMVTCAIIALLTAVAIPQYLNFQIKAARTEVVVILDAAHKGQEAYYSSVDHFLTGGCDSAVGLSQCSATLTQSSILNENFGLPSVPGGSLPTTPLGYGYLWTLTNGGQGYELLLYKQLNWTDSFADSQIIGVKGYFKNSLSCNVCGYEDGRPFLWYDELTGNIACPC